MNNIILWTKYWGAGGARQILAPDIFIASYALLIKLRCIISNQWHFWARVKKGTNVLYVSIACIKTYILNLYTEILSYKCGEVFYVNVLL